MAEFTLPANSKLRAGKTVYLAGKLRFDAHSTPKLNGFSRAAFISAHCAPREVALDGR